MWGGSPSVIPLTGKKGKGVQNMQTRSQLIHKLSLNYKLEHQPRTRILKNNIHAFFSNIGKVEIDMVCQPQLCTHEAAYDLRNT